MTISLRYAQRGLSLVELMIALLLGTILVAGAIKIFVSNSQAFRLQEHVSSAQESGRLALELVLADLRRAGIGAPSVVSAVSGKNNLTTTGSTLPGLLANSDEVTVAYVAPTAMSDCEGDAAPAGSTIANRYFVAADTNPAISALFCNGKVYKVDGTIVDANTNGTALVRGVESFQVLYGIADVTQKGNGFASAIRYVTAATPGTVQPVSSIRIGVVVRSEQGIQGVQPPANLMTVLDDTTSLTAAVLGAVKVNNMNPVHRYFSGTAALRNSTVGTL